MKNKYNFLPIVSLILSLIGAVLVACHILLPGIILAGIGFVGSIIIRMLKNKLNISELLCFLSLIISAFLLIASAVGFTAYSVWDYVSSKDIG